MATLATRVENNQIVLVTTVSLPRPQQGEALSVQALVDTGAQCTMVTARAVESLRAVSIDVRPFVAANGERQETEVFRLRVDIPIVQQALLEDGSQGETVHSVGADLEVMLLPFQPPNYEILLGMDFLAGFHITMWNGLFVLSN